MKIAIIGCGNIGSKRALSIVKDKSCKIKYIVGRKKFTNKSDHIGKKIVKWQKSRSECCDFTKKMELHNFLLEKWWCYLTEFINFSLKCSS